MTLFDGPSIGRRVTRYRKMNGWTMEDLASRTIDEGLPAVGKSVIANIENGRKVDVSVAQLVSLARALEVPPVALMMDLDDMSRRQSIVVGNTRTFDDALFGWITGHWPVPERDDDPPSKRDVERKIDALHDYIAAHRRAIAGPQSLEEDYAQVDAINARIEEINRRVDAGERTKELEAEVAEVTEERRVLTSRLEAVSSVWRNEDIALKRLKDLGVRVPRSSLLDGDA